MAKKRSDPYKKTPDTLQKAIVSMQRKITKNRVEFVNAPLTIEVEMGDGRTIERANPFVQEYRSMVRDFSAALKAYKDITNEKDDVQVSSLDSIRSKFRVAK